MEKSCPVCGGAPGSSCVCGGTGVSDAVLSYDDLGAFAAAPAPGAPTCVLCGEDGQEPPPAGGWACAECLLLAAAGRHVRAKYSPGR